MAPTPAMKTPPEQPLALASRPPLLKRLQARRFTSAIKRLLRLGHGDSSARRGQAKRDDTKLRALYLRLANALLASGHDGQAADLLKSALAAVPQDAQIVKLAALAHTRRENDAFACHLWRGLAERFPAHYGVQEKLKHANCLRKAGQLEQAQALYEQLHREQPGRPAGLVGQAWVAERAQHWSLAARLWQDCLDTYPDQARPRWEERRDRALMAVERMPANLEAATSQTAAAYLQHTSAQAQDANGAPSDLRFKSILIVTYGRSGSTLLQGLLNSIKGVLVRGENDNVFKHLFDLYQTLERRGRQDVASMNANSPWFGISAIDRDQLMNTLQGMARTIVVSDQQGVEAVHCFGFKEIRYPEMGERLADYLDFLSQVFPQTAFVFLTRNHNDVVSSGWWQDQDPDQVRQHLSDFEARTKAFAKDRQDCFQLSYADMVQKTQTLERLFAFLGAPYDKDIVELVLATPHSYGPTCPSSKALFRAL